MESISRKIKRTAKIYSLCACVCLFGVFLLCFGFFFEQAWLFKNDCYFQSFMISKILYIITWQKQRRVSIDLIYLYLS